MENRKLPIYYNVCCDIYISFDALHSQMYYILIIKPLSLN